MTAGAVRDAVDPRRLLATATALLEVPSPTGQAGAAADRLAGLLEADGFAVERMAAGHADAPAVITRLSGARPGPTLQFDGHLDTVHLPYRPPRLEGGVLTGSGAADMKAGVAAAVEALRAVRDAGGLPAGGLLLTAHDLHEAPWGYGEQLNAMIAAGVTGDAVMLPEYEGAELPVAGRGIANVSVTVRRAGEPMHEVLGGAEQPDVIAAGAELTLALKALAAELAAEGEGVAGRANVFIGTVAGGQMYNQSPVELTFEGTQRWLPGTRPEAAEQRLRDCLARHTPPGIRVDCRYQLIRGGFELDGGHPVVDAFDRSVAAELGGPLPRGPKRFADDGNSFSDLAGIPAITHGPRATGAHTVDERVPVDELSRVARVYAATALRYCAGAEDLRR